VRVCHIKGKTWADSVSEQGAEEVAWAKVVGSNRRLKKWHNGERNDLYTF